MKELRYALTNTLPIFFTYLFLGIAFGIMMSDAGYGVALSILAALTIYSGSMQMAMVPMMTAATPLPMLAVMTFFINARYMFYGVGFIDRFRKMGIRCPYMVVTLTDETYSLLSTAKIDAGLDRDKTSFLITLLDHSYWIFGCTLGACMGEFLQFDLRGIEFSATSFFLVACVNQWRQYKSKLPFFVATAIGIGLFLLLGKDLFLIPTLVLSFAVLILLRKPIEKQEGCADA